MPNSGLMPLNTGRLVIAVSTFIGSYSRVLFGQFLGNVPPVFGFGLSAGLGAFFGTLLSYVFVVKDFKSATSADLREAVHMGLTATVTGILVNGVGEMLLGGFIGTGADIVYSLITALVMYGFSLW